MATRWEVTKAVRRSDLPAPARLIMFTLADVAAVGTAEIPTQFTPSLSVLASETGLGKSTIKTHLALLEETGWVLRTRPDAKAQWHGERTKYRLSIPESADLGVGQESAQGGPVNGLGVGQEMTHPGPGDGLGVGQEMAGGRPGDGHLETDHSDPDQISTDPSSSAPPTKVEPVREDVERVCRHLADRIEANGSKRPTIGKTWRDAARRLFDLDGRTEEQVMKCIDWAQGDEFWRANILSMPTLREKYDQLRLAAQAQAAKASRASQRPTTDDKVSGFVERGRRLQAMQDHSNDHDRKELSA